MKEINLLGIRIDSLSWEEAQEKVMSFLNSDDQHTIFTPNPEMLVKAQCDEYFKYTFAESDLNLCDGRGIQLVSKEKIQRITGIDFMLEICRIAEKENKSIYLLGSGSDEVVKKTAENLKVQFPNLSIVGFSRGPKIVEISDPQKQNESGLDINAEENKKTIETINQAHPAILFVAFGMGKQEKWIFENLKKMPSVKIAMGIGGAFDYISEKVKRAPLLVRKLGLEWLYRLVRQPKRIVRIWNATVGFLLLTYLHKK